MSKWIYALVLAALAIGGGWFFLKKHQEYVSDQNSFALWKTFIPQTKLFKVQLPDIPHHVKDSVEIPGESVKGPYEVYVTEKLDGTLFLITELEDPKQYEETLYEHLFNTATEELMHSRKDNQLQKIEKDFNKKHPETEYSIFNRDYRIEGKILLVGNKRFTVSYITEKNLFDEDEYAYFINSFEVLPEEETKG